jgi:hypothetical protein
VRRGVGLAEWLALTGVALRGRGWLMAMGATEAWLEGLRAVAPSTVSMG